MSTDASKNTAAVKLIAASAINLNRMVKYLSTWNGTDNVLEILQNAIKLLIPFLHFKARLQHRAGLSKADKSAVANRMGKLVPLIGDSRMLFRFGGSLAILQWLLSLSKYPPATPKLARIERLQCYAMLGYYSLEHLFYLRVHEIIPPFISLSFSWKPIFLNSRRLVSWSCRFLAVYLLLQFAHLNEDRKLLVKKEKALARASEKDGGVEAEKVELQRKWAAFRLAVVSTACKLPISLHWALESGFFPNELVGSVVSFTASAITFRNGWAATAPVPPALPSVSPQATEDNGTARNAESSESQTTEGFSTDG